jgi:hypothetical protein
MYAATTLSSREKGESRIFETLMVEGGAKVAGEVKNKGRSESVRLGNGGSRCLVCGVEHGWCTIPRKLKRQNRCGSAVAFNGDRFS